MTNSYLMVKILEKLGVVSLRCPEFRFGQLIAAIGTLAEDDGVDLSLWDIENADFLAALDRFAADIADRHGRIAESATAPDQGGVVSSPSSIVPQPLRQ